MRVPGVRGVSGPTETQLLGKPVLRSLFSTAPGSRLPAVSGDCPRRLRVAYTWDMDGLLRFTVIDNEGTISFGGPGHLAKMMAAACAHSPASIDQVLATLATLDPSMTDSIKHGLARFDEFVVRDDATSIEQWIAQNDPLSGTAFRLIDSRLREATLTPLPLGVIMINLPDKRIVQIENRYGPILRKDRGRMRRDGEPISQVYTYELSSDWSLLP